MIYVAVTMGNFKGICEFTQGKSLFNVLLMAVIGVLLATKSLHGTNEFTQAYDPINVTFATKPLVEKII